MGLYFNIALFLPYKSYEGKVVLLEGVIVDRIVEFKNDNNSKNSKIYGEYIIRVKKFDKFKLIKSIKLKVYIEEELELGEEIVFKGRYSEGEKSRNYKGFSYKNYIRQNGILGIINVDNDEFKKIDNKINFESLFMKLKENINSRLEIYFYEEELGFMQSILLGNKNNLSKDIKKLFKDTSISHVLAISGMHVGIILISFENVLKKIIKNKRLISFFKIIFLIVFYILTGMQVSCFRSMLFNIFSIIYELRFEKNDIIKTVITTYFILIMVNIYNIFNIGMYLSFLSSVSIMVFNKLFDKVFNYYIKININISKNKYKYKSKKSNRIVSFLTIFLKSNFIISISAQVLIIPIMIYNFNFFSYNFIISNIFISIFVSWILKFGYLIIIFDVINIFDFKFIVFINLIFSKFLSMCLKFIFCVLEMIRSLEFLDIILKTPNIIVVLLYYFIILLLIYKFNNNVFKYYKKLLIIFNKNRRKNILNIIIIRKVFEKYLKKYRKLIYIIILFLILNVIIIRLTNKRLKFIFYRCRTGRLYFN